MYVCIYIYLSRYHIDLNVSTCQIMHISSMFIYTNMFFVQHIAIHYATQKPFKSLCLCVAGDCRDCAMPATRTESLQGISEAETTDRPGRFTDGCVDRGLQSASSCMGSALDPGGTCQVECRQPYYKGAKPKGYGTSKCLKKCLGIHDKSTCVLGDGSAILQHVGSLVLQHLGSSSELKLVAVRGPSFGKVGSLVFDAVEFLEFCWRNEERHQKCRLQGNFP